mgnify:CR=1 FL=1
MSAAKPVLALAAAPWALSAASGLALLSWKWLLHTVIVRCHLAHTGVRFGLAFPGPCDVAFHRTVPCCLRFDLSP